MGLEVAAEFPPIKSIKTKPGKSLVGEGEQAVEEVKTPKSEDSVLKPLLICPPAPKKQRRPLKRKLAQPSNGFFVVPCDLTSIFVAISSPRVAKKIKPAG